MPHPSAPRLYSNKPFHSARRRPATRGGQTVERLRIEQITKKRSFFLQHLLIPPISFPLETKGCCIKREMLHKHSRPQKKVLVWGDKYSKESSPKRKTPRQHFSHTSTAVNHTEEHMVAPRIRSQSLDISQSWASVCNSSDKTSGFLSTRRQKRKVSVTDPLFSNISGQQGAKLKRCTARCSAH